MKRFVLPLAAITLGACSHSAPAPTPATPPPAPVATQAPAAPGHAMSFAKLLQRFDANKDGKLQVAELPPRAQQRFGKADANADGVIDANEVTAFVAARVRQRFDRADTDHDGFITEAEAGKRWQRVKVADADGDGKVSLAELQKAVDAGTLRPERRPRRARR